METHSRDAIRTLRSDHLAGLRGGMFSICSARREVLEAAMEMTRAGAAELLVEATANQVNQFGGYSGMTPSAFASYVIALASAGGFPHGKILLGADHLGPYVWRHLPADEAMANCLHLVRQCVGAGFHKIHLDTAFRCADDPRPRLPLGVAAERAARLCREAEETASRLPPNMPPPLYVIGAEVPPPGGALVDPEALEVTPVAEVAAVLEAYRSRFLSLGLESAWQRVMAVVVQPGVEFGDFVVAGYRPEKAEALSAYHSRLPGIMTYEIHSTDYQSTPSLTRMVRDHFALLKVGPCLTYAFRAAVFALEDIETEWLRTTSRPNASGLRQALENVMQAHPAHWHSHYRGTEEECRRLRFYSYRDRIRYYWGHPEVEAALNRLMHNLPDPVPVELIRQFLPEISARAVSDGGAHPAALIRLRIQSALAPYRDACSSKPGEQP